jgi:hypothetical protein
MRKAKSGTDIVLAETQGDRIGTTSIPMSNMDVLFVGTAVQGDSHYIRFMVKDNINDVSVEGGVLEIYAL